ncbi:hypothetical protein E2320_008519, partial [Naja naja]
MVSLPIVNLFPTLIRVVDGGCYTPFLYINYNTTFITGEKMIRRTFSRNT